VTIHGTRSSPARRTELERSPNVLGPGDLADTLLLASRAAPSRTRRIAPAAVDLAVRATESINQRVRATLRIAVLPDDSGPSETSNHGSARCARPVSDVALAERRDGGKRSRPRRAAPDVSRSARDRHSRWRTIILLDRVSAPVIEPRSAAARTGSRVLVRLADPKSKSCSDAPSGLPPTAPRGASDLIRITPSPLAGHRLVARRSTPPAPLRSCASNSLLTACCRDRTPCPISRRIPRRPNEIPAGSAIGHWPLIIRVARDRLGQRQRPGAIRPTIACVSRRTAGSATTAVRTFAAYWSSSSGPRSAPAAACPILKRPQRPGDWPRSAPDCFAVCRSWRADGNFCDQPGRAAGRRPAARSRAPAPSRSASRSASRLSPQRCPALPCIRTTYSPWSGAAVSCGW